MWPADGSVYVKYWLKKLARVEAAEFLWNGKEKLRDVSLMETIRKNPLLCDAVIYHRKWPIDRDETSAKNYNSILQVNTLKFPLKE